MKNDLFPASAKMVMVKTLCSASAEMDMVKDDAYWLGFWLKRSLKVVLAPLVVI